MSESLAERLTAFTEQLGRLPETEEPPPTTLQILGRSKQEQDWQRLLFHFLSPEGGHGLGHELLEHLLTALSEREDLEFEFSRFDLDGIQVQTEVVTSGGGRPDAVLWSGDEWFICWELKVTASEGGTQTRAYVAAESFDSIDLRKDTVPPDGHHYVYLAPASSAPPDAPEFVQISWEWLASQLQSFLSQGHGRYPAQTTAQLTEFISTIQNELTMTEYRENRQEKASLYFDYYEEIGEAREAFESRWTEFGNDWGTRLASTVDGGAITDIPGLPDENVAIEVAGASGDSRRWIFRQGNSDWGGIVEDGWWRAKDDLSHVYEQQEGREDIRIALYHRLEQNRDRAIRDHTLEIELWHGTDNGDEFMYSFRDTLAEKIDPESGAFPTTVELTGRRAKPLVLTYDIPARDHDDFFDAYLAALQTAFRDITVDHEGLVDAIDDTLEECLEAHL